MPLNGKIYAIQQKGTQETIYVGSTCNSLPIRWGNHKQSLYAFPKRKVYQRILEHGGIENFEMVLIEEMEVVDRKDLLQREGYHIRQLRPCGNRYIAGCSKEERSKVYYEQHKERIREYQLEYQRKYRELHRDVLNEKKRVQYKKKKEKETTHRNASGTAECFDGA